MKPRTLIIRTAGTNCDRELAFAFESAGSATESIHLNVLMEQPELLDRFDLLGVPGGFSYGDDVAAGKIMALLMQERLYPALRRCIERGVPMFAPCNGFQVLVKMGLLPGPGRGQAWPADRPPTQSVTLLDNGGGRFIDRWVGIEVDAQSPCIWTQHLTDVGSEFVLPIAHGEGRFVTDAETLGALEADHLIALRYAEGQNVNGSMSRVAGLCDASGLIFGLMPHPERFTTWTQHPRWTRLDPSILSSTPLGLAMFRNAVRHAAAQRV